MRLARQWRLPINLLSFSLFRFIDSKIGMACPLIQKLEVDSEPNRKVETRNALSRGNIRARWL